MKKLPAIVSLALLLSVQAFSQDKYMLEIKNDVKTIHPSELGLPESATLTEILSLLPELLSRPKIDILTNYDIQISGFSLGSAKEAAMTMLHVGDISSIDITESSVNSYTSKGTGGSINISLKDIDKGLSGNVDLSVYTIPQVSPTVHLGYRKDKFFVRGLFGLSWFKKGDMVVDRIYDYPIDSEGAFAGQTFTGADTTTVRSTVQMAHIFAQYNPTKSDVISIQMSQSYNKDGEDHNGYTIQDGFKTTVDKVTAKYGLNLSVEAMYRHTFADNSKLKFQANYSGSPKSLSTDDSFARNLSTKNHSGTFAGKVDYTYSFRDAADKEMVNLNVGVNANRSDSDAEHEEIMNIFGMTQYNHNSYTSAVTSYLSPYAQFETLLGKVRIKAKADYQYFHYNLDSRNDEDFNVHRNDFTFKLMAGWQFADHNHLRLFVDRKLRRPSNLQLYPVVLYDPSRSDFAKGNPNLAPEQIHEVSLDYITDRKTRSGAYLVANADLSFIHVADRIRTVTGDKETEQKYPYDFLSFSNSGYNNLFNANLMLYYRKGIFNLSFTGNLYMNYDVTDKVTDHYNYYSLSLYPSFHFKNDWRTSLQLIYHSPVSTNSVSYGHSASASLYVGKSWGGMSVGLVGRLQLIKRTTDVIHGASGQVTYETYVPGYNGVALNLNYRF